ncbi:cytochrome b/b6 domain-containing protein [Hydrogenophaga pseudoflava]|uniref:cytochrome b/b6 domain-containing protein n=1 Tax=Hydrogenophaga pseudoflava TaxID=47421 RepID=UPI0027E5A18F|nr:cytochrome b/b6 domain-containing protein [Hydrogenophaga pseudoflava]MDQ7747454.1 cytochrome b/b6 domain-containing protein [Hydrogenophaga pseudoflava]
MHTIRVWDLPTRLFHWALALCVIGLVVTANVGGSWMIWHGRLGYTVLSLLLFRIVWGFVGGHWSRFSSFLYGPSAVLAYLRGNARPEHRVGHNPLGMLSVFALLVVLLLQVSTGLFADDEIAFTGPLASLVSGDTVSQATRYHKSVGKLLLIALVVLHVLAILVYKWIKKDNLLGAMVLGDKQVATPLPSARDSASSRLLALLIWAVCAAAVYWVVGLGQTPSSGG